MSLSRIVAVPLAAMILTACPAEDDEPIDTADIDTDSDTDSDTDTDTDTDSDSDSDTDTEPCDDPCAGTPTVTDVDGNVYDTIGFGCDCWMAENLRVGLTVEVDPDTPREEQSDNDTIERFCFDNRDPACEANGGLYQWPELTGHGGLPQGICPDGWHVSTDAEWKALEVELGMSQSDADDESGSIPRGTDQGQQLTDGGRSGFDAPPAGLTFFVIGTIYDFARADNPHFWTADGSSRSALRRKLDADGGVFRDRSDPLDEYSARCVKDR